MKGGIAVLDFGSQYTQLIAKRFRQMGVYSELFPYNVSVETLRERQVKGIVLSGGPSSVNEEGAPVRALAPLYDIAPLLGVCYGMQLIVKDMGGVVESSERREYGLNQVLWSESLSRQVPAQQKVWMSHGDVIKKLPPQLQVIATSENGHPAALRGERVWAFQFHPEVTHTDCGIDLIKEFAFTVCKIEKKWTPPEIVEQLVADIKMRVGNGRVLCALSGGVDSTVVGALLTKALTADRVQCVFVNNGLLRKNEYQQVLAQYHRLGLNVQGIDAEQRFLKELSGVSDPETKRKIIGRVFIEVFQENIKVMKIV